MIGVLGLTGAVVAFLKVTPFALFFVGCFNLSMSGLDAIWRFYAERTPDSQRQLLWPQPVRPGDEQSSFTLIVCALDEAAVIGGTLETLLRQSHRSCQIIVSLRDHDRATIKAVEAFISAHPGGVELLVRSYDEPGKAPQLNGALTHATGAYVGRSTLNATSPPTFSCTSRPSSGTPGPTSCKARCS